MAMPPPGLPFSPWSPPPPGEGPEGSRPGGMGMRPSFICSMWSMLSGPSLSIILSAMLGLPPSLSGPFGPLQPTRGGMLAVRLPSLELVLPPEPDAVFFLLEEEGPSLGLGEPSFKSSLLLWSEEEEEDALPFSPPDADDAAAAATALLARLKRC